MKKIKTNGFFFIISLCITKVGTYLQKDFFPETRNPAIVMFCCIHHEFLLLLVHNLDVWQG